MYHAKGQCVWDEMKELCFIPSFQTINEPFLFQPEG